ncbi:serine/arginine repetitive matrix protein 2-like isoform X2 [Eriocheir sinensis]|nr:serine/arginine repetitive matrix protein 2-like isoform X2 [Eriocheir sinensis]
MPTSARRPRVPAQLGVPWRVEHRLYERREGLEPGSMVKEHFGEQPQPSVGEAASQSPRASASEGEVTVMKIRRKLQHYRGKYHKEREQRRRLERKLSRIQTQLKGLHTLDEATITHIEECFVKFQVFLSMMQNSGEHLQTSSSSGAASPVPQPTEPSTSFHLPPGMNLPPGAFFPNLPFSIPVPVFLQQPAHEVTSQSQEITPTSQPVPAPPSASVEGRHNGTKKTISDRKAIREADRPSQNREDIMNLTPSITDTMNPVVSPGHSFRGTKSEMPKEGRPNLARVASQQYRNDPPGFALNGRDNRDEETMKQEETSEKKMLNQMNEGKQIIIMSNSKDSYPAPIHSSSRPVKQKQTVGTQVTNGILESEVAEVKSPRNQETRSRPTNIDTLAMRVEVGDLKEERLRAGKTMDTDEKESHNLKENGESEMSVQSVNHAVKMSEITKEETKKTMNTDEEETHNMKENREHEMRFQSINYSLKTSEMIKEERHPRKAQHHFKNNSSEEVKPAQEDRLSSPLRSPGSEADQSLRDIQLLQEIQSIHSARSSHHPQSSQSVHTSQSYSSQPPYEIQFVGESPLPRHSSSSPRKSPPLVRYRQESQSPRSQSHASQSPQSQSPHSQSPNSHSPNSKSPQSSSHSQSPQNQSPHSQSPRSPPPHSQFPHSQSPHSHIHSPSNQQPQETHSPKRNQSQQNQSLSPLTKPPQSPHSQSPSNPQQPQEAHSPKRNQVQQNQSHPTLGSQSPHESHLPQDAHLPPKKRSPKRHSPKKSRSPREEWGGEVQASEVSETDDEKMRNLSAWLHGRMRGRASTPPSSSSSYSISEQLQQSHTSWTKGQGHRRSKEGGKEEEEWSRREGGKEVKEMHRWRDRGGKEGEEMPKGKEEEEGHRGREGEKNVELSRGRERGGKKVEELTRGREREDEVRGESEFEFDASDLEDLSITGLTLTNTSLPEEIHTPGDEDF